MMPTAARERREVDEWSRVEFVSRTKRTNGKSAERRGQNAERRGKTQKEGGKAQKEGPKQNRGRGAVQRSEWAASTPRQTTRRARSSHARPSFHPHGRSEEGVSGNSISENALLASHGAPLWIPTRARTCKHTRTHTNTHENTREHTKTHEHTRTHTNTPQVSEERMAQSSPGRAALRRVEPEETLKQGGRVVRRARQQVREGDPAPPRELVQELAGLSAPDVGYLLRGGGAKDVEDQGELVHETRPCRSICQFVDWSAAGPARVCVRGVIFNCSVTNRYDRAALFKLLSSASHAKTRTKNNQKQNSDQHNQ